MPYRLYLDTSVFGALFDVEDARRVAVTRRLLRRARRPPFEAFVGIPLYEEVARAPETIRAGLEIAIRRLRPTVVEEEDDSSLSLAEACVPVEKVRSALRSSFPRKRESSSLAGFWTPAFAGVTEETSFSTRCYVRAGVVGQRHRDDARHLALATVARVDTAVSWNFRHMVNVEKKRLVHSVNARRGHHLIDIVSPLEVADV